MKNRKTFLKAALMLTIIFSFAGCGLINGSSNGPKLVITTNKNKTEYAIEIADNYDERKEGLMFRTSLAERHGMLFIFDYPEKLKFWMKNTLIPLDMLFFDKDYRIINIEKNAQPCTKDPCNLYFSSGPAQYVMEINGGEADKFGIEVGNTAQLSK